MSKSPVKSPWGGRIKPQPIQRAAVTPSIPVDSQAASRKLGSKATRASPLGGSVERILAQIDTTTAAKPIVRTAITAIVAGEERGFGVGGSDGSLSGDVAFRSRAKAVLAFNDVGAASVAAWETEIAELVERAGAVAGDRKPDAAIRVTVPVIGLVADPAALITDIIKSGLKRLPEHDGELMPGARLGRQIKDNLLRVSGISEDDARRRSDRLKWPSSQKLGGAELVSRYLVDTPWRPFLLAPAEASVSIAALYESMHICARIGHGKTQCLEWLIVELLKHPSMPSIVVVDSQGYMLRRLARLKTFAPGGRYHDKLVFIDPGEATRPVALNPLQIGHARLKTYSPRVAETVRNMGIALLEYLFSAIFGTELTGKQKTYFRYCIELLLAIPDASVTTLRDVLDRPEDFADVIAGLDGDVRKFWDSQGFAKQYKETRDQISRRLWQLASERSLARLISTPENKLDWFQELQAGCIVLADTSKALLQPEGSAIMGRMIVAMAYRAMYEREAIPREERRPTFLIIDEAQDVVDKAIEDGIAQGRKYAYGTFLAHQFLDQLPLILRRELAGQIGVKLIGAVAAHDARSFSQDMGVSDGFLMGLRKVKGGTEFALAVRNEIGEALRLTVPFGAVDREPRMSEADWAGVESRMLTRYGSSGALRPSPASPAPAATGASTPTPRLQPGATTTGWDNDDDDWASSSA